MSVIAGLDEAGRGALAGPVVAGAVVFINSGSVPDFITDSKQLTRPQRQQAYDWIVANTDWGVGLSSAEEIDQHGICPANHLAMKRALAQLKSTPTHLLIDGRDKFKFAIPSTDIVGGDGLEPVIGAASIVAKVTRDRFMVDQEKAFPEWGFRESFGYGTPPHLALIQTLDPTPIHRRSFDPLRTKLHQHRFEF